MKKSTVVAGILVLAIAGFSAMSASAQIQSTTSAELNSGGGLGKGLNYMVRSILGDTQESAASVVAPQATTMMMQVNTAADTTTAPPQARSLKAAPEAASLMMASALTEDGLHKHIQSLMRVDSNLQSVDTAETHVRLTYAFPVKAFGFVPVMARVTVGAYVSGRTEVSYPWYAFSTKTLSNEFKTRVKEHVVPLIPPQEFTLEAQQTLINEIHVVLAGEFGSSTSGDQ